MKIVFGGFQHETNTFAPSKATLHDFIIGSGFPGLCQGDEIFARIHGADIPAAGFVEAASRKGHMLVPTAWAAATPAAHVTTEAFERICGLIVDGIRQALPADAIYLDLHGAMVTEDLDDGEGEILRRVRDVAGHDIPIAVSLDLHANVTRAMLTLADFVVAFRTYPHVDKARTGERAFEYLQKVFDGMPRQAMSMAKIPFLIPLCWQSTLMEPARSIYQRISTLENDGGVLSASLAMGFPAADMPDCGALAWAYGATQGDAAAAANKLADSVIAAGSGFSGRLYPPDEAVAYASDTAARLGKPVVIADAQDNPGAGGNSDTTGILAALVRAGVQNAAIGLIVDPAAAKQACAAGPGHRLHMAIGGHSGIEGDSPFEGDFLVECVSDGRFDATGPFYAGIHLQLGPSACLRIGGVRIVLASKKVQMADQAMFRFAGIEPTREKILVVKSSTHFRADFGPISGEIIVCTAPGPMPMNPAKLPWTRLPPDLLMYPGGPTFAELHTTADRQSSTAR